MSTDTYDTHNETSTDPVEPTAADPGASEDEPGTLPVEEGNGDDGSVDDGSADDGSADDTGAHDGEGDGTMREADPPAGARMSRRELLEAEGDVAADFLEALLDICDIVGDIDVDIDGDRAAVSIVDSEEGRVPRRLVGPEGKVLEAMQELTRLAVQTETGERSRLMLDIAGHRAARRAEIVEVAQRVIATVQQSGDPVEMEPMTAFERKIVHDEVLAAGLRSESDGVEPRRYVVVLPAS